jgi:hypothetical protein
LRYKKATRDKLPMNWIDRISQCRVECTGICSAFTVVPAERSMSATNSTAGTSHRPGGRR